MGVDDRVSGKVGDRGEGDVGLDRGGTGGGGA